jgi:hypothetical protein
MGYADAEKILQSISLSVEFVATVCLKLKFLFNIRLLKLELFLLDLHSTRSVGLLTKIAANRHMWSIFPIGL